MRRWGKLFLNSGLEIIFRRKDNLLNPLRHADGTRGTDKAAEVATYAARADDVGTTCCGVEGDGLMATIHAGCVATSATYAALGIDLWIDDGAAIEVGRCDEVGEFFANQVR